MSPSRREERRGAAFLLYQKDLTGGDFRALYDAYEGYRVPPFYDSLLAKLIVWGEDRAQALDRARRALGELEIDGVATTATLFAEIVEEPVFRSGAYTTAYLDDARDRLRSLAPEVPV